MHCVPKIFRNILAKQRNSNKDMVITGLPKIYKPKSAEVTPSRLTSAVLFLYAFFRRR